MAAFDVRWRFRFGAFLVNGEFTGEILGRGGNGVVEKVKSRPSEYVRSSCSKFFSPSKVIVNGQVCAGKSIYEELVDPDNVGGSRTIIDRYLRECEIMSRLNHSNVTRFVGVCVKPDYSQPVLLMAKLDGNFDDLISGFKDPNLPLSLTLSIITDVAKGLHYLHDLNAEETIIHRDLTTRNVLLTSNMVAQITDFGMSRIVNKRAVLTLSPVPGCPVYMARETLARIIDGIEEENAHYGPSLDVFSFGHLSLVALTQVCV